MRTKSIFLAAVLLLSGGAARAQQAPWSLTDCISYALEHNLTVQQSAIKVEQQEVELSTAQGRRLPTVNASASENFSFGARTRVEGIPVLTLAGLLEQKRYLNRPKDQTDIQALERALKIQEETK